MAVHATSRCEQQQESLLLLFWYPVCVLPWSALYNQSAVGCNGEALGWPGAQFGAVQQVLIPRPSPAGQPPPPGLGKVIVAFEEVSAANSARAVLNGRKFGGRVVVCTFLSEEAYAAGSLD